MARWLAVVVAVLALAAILDGWVAFGKKAAPEVVSRSPEWHDGKFRNPQPLHNSARLMLSGALHASADTSPKEPVPTVATDPKMLMTPPASGLRVTWLGHSTTLVEIDGHRILTDPVWSDRVGPVHLIGPRPWFAPPIAMADLPPIDAVVISHDHYDHLDMKTIVAMKEWKTIFYVPVGVGANLQYWGIPAERIFERDWWDASKIGDLEIVCLPARHASGRMLVDDDAKLWAGWALLGPKNRVYYSGDTGLFPAMKDIGERFGPFDLTMIEVGQYHAAWPDWHIGPEQAVRAHAIVKGRVMLPVHWGKIALAYHGWTEPIERALAAGTASGAKMVAPKPGQSFEPSAPPAVEHWWPNVPWQTAAEAPIVSSQTEGL